MESENQPHHADFATPPPPLPTPSPPPVVAVVPAHVQSKRLHQPSGGVGRSSNGRGGADRRDGAGSQASITNGGGSSGLSMTWPRAGGGDGSSLAEALRAANSMHSAATAAGGHGVHGEHSSYVISRGGSGSGSGGGGGGGSSPGLIYSPGQELPELVSSSLSSFAQSR